MHNRTDIPEKKDISAFTDNGTGISKEEKPLMTNQKFIMIHKYVMLLRT